MKFNSEKEAARHSFKTYDNSCIFSNSLDIVTCHIFPKGANPELRWVSENIVPANAIYHTNSSDTLDYIHFQTKERPAINRIEFIFDNIQSEYYSKFTEQMVMLWDELLKYPRFGYYAEQLNEILKER